jgi:hypothetical protein
MTKSPKEAYKAKYTDVWMAGHLNFVEIFTAVLEKNSSTAVGCRDHLAVRYKFA